MSAAHTPRHVRRAHLCIANMLAPHRRHAPTLRGYAVRIERGGVMSLAWFVAPDAKAARALIAADLGIEPAAIEFIRPETLQ